MATGRKIRLNEASPQLPLLDASVELEEGDDELNSEEFDISIYRMRKHKHYMLDIEGAVIILDQMKAEALLSMLQSAVDGYTD